MDLKLLVSIGRGETVEATNHLINEREEFHRCQAPLTFKSLKTHMVLDEQGSGMCTEPKYLKRLKPMYKFWLESEDGYVFGQGSFELLRGIQEKGSLSGSAKIRGMSYRYAWGIIKEIEKRMGKPILETHKGGKSGGCAKLTRTGRNCWRST